MFFPNITPPHYELHFRGWKGGLLFGVISVRKNVSFNSSFTFKGSSFEHLIIPALQLFLAVLV